MLEVAMVVIVVVVMIATNANADRADMHADDRGIRSANRQGQRQCRSDKSFHDDSLFQFPAAQRTV
jgi:hypothetical protein